MVIPACVMLAVSAAIGPACSVSTSTDGLVAEWPPAALVATDPSGDASGAFDVTTLYAASQGDVLRLRFDTGTANHNLQAGAGGDGTLRIELAHDGQSLTIDLRDRRAYRNGNPADTVAWHVIGWASAPTYAAPEYEAQLNVAEAVGATVGDTIWINFSGSDTLSSPANFTLTAPAVNLNSGDAGRAPGTDVRIAALNTRSTGLLSSRASALGRLIAAVDADIYCLCEEYNSTASQLQSILSGFFPIDIAWNVVKEGDNVIATPFPMTQVPTGTSRYAAALVETGSGPLFVVSVHFKCCGFVGDSSDNQRIGEAQGVAQLIADFRAGAVNGGALAGFTDAPVVVAGDWNLVGSKAPLEVLEAGSPGPGLAAPPIRHLNGDAAYTWRSDGSSFWPGRLDLIAYSPDNLRRTGAFVLDSERLDGGQLSALGLQASDSDASDHLLLVTDVAITCGGDINLSGGIDLTDLQEVLFNFGQATDPFGCADVDGSGGVALGDIQLILFDFGQVCTAP